MSNEYHGVKKKTKDTSNKVLRVINILKWLTTNFGETMGNNEKKKENSFSLLNAMLNLSLISTRNETRKIKDVKEKISINFEIVERWRKVSSFIKTFKKNNNKNDLGENKNSTEENNFGEKNFKQKYKNKFEIESLRMSGVFDSSNKMKEKKEIVSTITEAMNDEVFGLPKVQIEIDGMVSFFTESVIKIWCEKFLSFDKKMFIELFDFMSDERIIKEIPITDQFSFYCLEREKVEKKENISRILRINNSNNKILFESPPSNRKNINDNENDEEKNKNNRFSNYYHEKNLKNERRKSERIFSTDLSHHLKEFGSAIKEKDFDPLAKDSKRGSKTTKSRKSVSVVSTNSLEKDSFNFLKKPSKDNPLSSSNSSLSSNGPSTSNTANKSTSNLKDFSILRNSTKNFTLRNTVNLLAPTNISSSGSSSNKEVSFNSTIMGTSKEENSKKTTKEEIFQRNSKGEIIQTNSKGDSQQRNSKEENSDPLRSSSHLKTQKNQEIPSNTQEQQKTYEKEKPLKNTVKKTAENKNFTTLGSPLSKEELEQALNNQNVSSTVLKKYNVNLNSKSITMNDISSSQKNSIIGFFGSNESDVDPHSVRNTKCYGVKKIDFDLLVNRDTGLGVTRSDPSAFGQGSQQIDPKSKKKKKGFFSGFKKDKKEEKK